MEGMAQSFKLIGAIDKAWLQQFPSGRWGLIGKAILPIELTVEYTSGFTTGRKCKTWNTREDAVAELTAHGVKFE